MKCGLEVFVINCKRNGFGIVCKICDIFVKGLSLKLINFTLFLFSQLQTIYDCIFCLCVFPQISSQERDFSFNSVYFFCETQWWHTYGFKILAMVTPHVFSSFCLYTFRAENSASLISLQFSFRKRNWDKLFLFTY